MNKFLDQIGDKLLPLANKLAANRYLTVLRDAFMLSFPLTMFGSIVVVFNNLPFFNDATKATWQWTKCNDVNYDSFCNVWYWLLFV